MGLQLKPVKPALPSLANDINLYSFQRSGKVPLSKTSIEDMTYWSGKQPKFPPVWRCFI